MKKQIDIPPTPFEGGAGLCFLISLLLVIMFSCTNAQNTDSEKENLDTEIIVGAERTEQYFPLLKGRNIGIVANQTSMIGNTHLVDTIHSSGLNVVKVFGPEHGFRGEAADGEHVENDIDLKTGIQIVSLYGANRKPSKESLEGIDLMIFDIQDVGARFYTYISTMSYVMEACAKNGIEFMVLDRPNPHGDYVDGPVLEKNHSSFVGLHQVPVVHGMTVGEYAQMVNGEEWLKGGIKCELTVIPCENYDHNKIYELPIAPSPNLPNNLAIQLYPSLCLFEGTFISIGRGTEFPFQVIGHPDYLVGSFTFTPEAIAGVANSPKYEGELCFGKSLIGYADSILNSERKLHLNWLIDFHDFFSESDNFFTHYFVKLVGTNELQIQLYNKKNEEEIRMSWKKDLKKFKQIRKKYLIYTDFE